MEPNSKVASHDPWDLHRFVEAQRDTFSIALDEIRQGKKRSHWMWFVFPQLAGLGFSSMAQYYAIHSTAEAQAYLNHPLLGSRLLEISQALSSLQGKSAREILGEPDDLKLRSCLTLFSQLDQAPPIFRELLQQYFDGEPDARTLQLLKQ